MEVPFHSQRNLGALGREPIYTGQTLTWPERSCAIACLTMVLQHFGHAVTMEDVLRAGLANGGFDPGRGWLHSGQVAVLQSYGLAAYRRNWRLMDGREAEYLAGRELTPQTRREIALVKRGLLDEGAWAVRRLTREVPVILSVYRPRGDTSSIGHQVVVLDADLDRVTFHDPAQRAGAYTSQGADSFFANWKGTAIVAFQDAGKVNPNTG